MKEKPGYKTTEFWLTLAPWILALGVFVLMGVGTIDTQTGVLLLGVLGIGGGVSNLGYSNSRGNIKASNRDNGQH